MNRAPLIAAAFLLGGVIAMVALVLYIAFGE